MVNLNVEKEIGCPPGLELIYMWVLILPFQARCEYAAAHKIMHDIVNVAGVSPMVQFAKSVALNIDDQAAVSGWRRQNQAVSENPLRLKNQKAMLSICNLHFVVVQLHQAAALESGRATFWRKRLLAVLRQVLSNKPAASRTPGTLLRLKGKVFFESVFFKVYFQVYFLKCIFQSVLLKGYFSNKPAASRTWDPPPSQGSILSGFKRPAVKVEELHLTWSSLKGLLFHICT